MKTLILLTSSLFVGFVAQAQQLNTEFKITKILPAFQASPIFQGVQYDKRGNRPKSWLEVEIAFEWQPRLREPLYLDNITINYYILLNNKTQKNRQGTLLTGSVSHINIPQGKDLRSVVYVSPRTLEKFFEGKSPTNPAQAIIDVGVTISNSGKLVAEASWKGRGQWWSQMQPVADFVLNKNQTPFAPLQWDYFEDIKPENSAP